MEGQNVHLGGGKWRQNHFNRQGAKKCILGFVIGIFLANLASRRLEIFPATRGGCGLATEGTEDTKKNGCFFVVFVRFVAKSSRFFWGYWRQNHLIWNS